MKEIYEKLKWLREYILICYEDNMILRNKLNEIIHKIQEHERTSKNQISGRKNQQKR